MSDSQAADAAPSQIGWRFDNRYARLPERFFTRVRPVPVKAPSVVLLNHGLANSLACDWKNLRSQMRPPCFREMLSPRDRILSLRPMRVINTADSPCSEMAALY